MFDHGKEAVSGEWASVDGPEQSENMTWRCVVQVAEVERLNAQALAGEPGRATNLHHLWQ